MLCVDGSRFDAVTDLDENGAVVTASIVGRCSSGALKQSVNPRTSVWQTLHEYAETLRMSA